jgi:uncharacterized protein DUF4129
VRSRADRPVGRIAIAAAVMMVMLTPSVARAQRPARPSVDEPTASDIDRAIERIKTDPNLAAQQTIKTLKWRSSTEASTSTMPGWLLWIAGFFKWIEQSARTVVWVAAAVLAGLIGVYVSRIIRAQRESTAIGGFVAPTHVHDLDIRPETLPDDIGAASRALWDGGEHRAALALLYRGLLSRLAHVHHVPIRDSSTEGDCLVLAAAHLHAERRDYAARLVRVWQRFVYGREEVMPATIYALCDEFTPSLDATAARGPVPEGSGT